MAAIILAAISTAVYLVLTLMTFRSIHIVRARDAMHRHHSDSESYHLLPEDEMQRQQLLRLLLQRENSKKVSPDVGQSTFRIDLPESLRRMETHLTAPQSVYESRDNRENYNSRSFNFSPLSPFSSSRNRPSPYEAVSQEQPPVPPIPQQHQEPSMNQTIARDFSTSSHAPPYSAAPGAGDGSISRYPTEKSHNIADLHGEIHPLERERPQYHVVEPPAEEDVTRLMDPRRNPRKGGQGDIRRQRSTSRESRRAEIELERGKGKSKGDSHRAELEGIKISPRINRVETDGWGRK
ncbi:MAG: hypothetical protein Q9220_000899 [cf. Caloplaca sp. 1 TL-2023]